MYKNKKISNNNNVKNMYYNYHGIIKRKIKEGLLVGYEFTDSYKGIGKALVLYFSDGTKKPIRERHFLEYLIIINKYFTNNKGHNPK